ncbi:MAG: polysaccharide biosynthesis tyrosine autokinase [Sphingomonadaceae bacterium]|nr:polysaccharide biosynthesis tyrosine autokinase [Sphingomonadaceae bacterium]
MTNIATRRQDGGDWLDARQKTRALSVQDEAYIGAENSPDTDFNLATIARIVSNWRWVVLGAITICLVAALLAAFIMRPIYRAVSTLEISPPTVDVTTDNKEEKETSSSTDFLATQYGLLRSRSLAERVGQELNLASNPIFVTQGADRATRQREATNKLVQNLNIAPVPESRLVRVIYDSPDAALSARIVNSFGESFIATNLERRYEASSYARSFLERQIGKIKTELEASERQLVSYAQSQGILNVSSGKDGSDTTSLQGASLVSINQALADAQTRRIAAEQAYRQSGTVGATAEVTASGQALRQQRAALEADYQDKLTRMKPEFPDMVSLRSRISELTRQLAQEGVAVQSGRSNTLLSEYRAAAAAERALQSRVAQLKNSVLDLRERSIRYTILQRDVDTNRSLYDALLQRYKEIGVAGGVGKNLVSIVDRAEVPLVPYKPNLLVNLLIGLGAGIGLGLGLAILLEFMNDTIKVPDDVRDKLKLSSLGVIPVKDSDGPFAQELNRQGSPISEAYFSLRTTLQFTTGRGAPKTLLVTSSRAGEGKSSTTLALAQNFARLGQSVLLIDADLRRPAFVSGIDSVGLSQLLTNQDPLDAHALATHVDNLWLIPCGPLPPSPAELLASPRLAAILAEAAAAFDMVIVDGPPVLGLADAPLLGAVCESTIVIIESGKTRTRLAIDSLNRLRASGSDVLGAVLTKFRHQAHGYGYGYGYDAYKYKEIGNRDREIRLITQVKDASGQ